MVFEEANTSNSDEVSRPVVPASPMRAALFLSLSLGVERRELPNQIPHANPARLRDGVRQAGRGNPRAALEDRGKDESKRDWPRSVTHPATRYTPPLFFIHVFDRWESGGVGK